MTEKPARSARAPYFLACLLLAVLRLWLTHDIPVSLLAHDVDDSLYLRHADALSRGEWLGDYDQNLLVKGPGYGAFLALAKVGNVPRRTAEDLLQILAALAALWSLRRAGLAAPLAVAAFAVLLFHPACLLGAATRVAREGVYYAQTLLVLSFGLALVPKAPARQRIALALLLGVVLAWSWQTRGEGIWFVPALALCAAGSSWLRREHLLRELTFVGCAAVVLAALVHGVDDWVERRNEQQYGAAVSNELKDAPFNAAVGALQRVADARWSRYEPLRLDQRERLAELSPAFREVRPVIEQRIAAAGTPTLAEDGALMGIFLSWALRDAAASAGHHRSLPASRAFYRRLANEVNAACDAGSIPCGAPRKGQTPRFESSLSGVLFERLVAYERESIAPEWIRLEEEPPLPLVLVPEEDQRVAERVLGGPVVGSGMPTLRRRWSGLRILAAAVLQAGMALRLIGVVALIGLAFTARGRSHPLFWCAAALESALLTRAALVAGLETFWFKDVAIYLVPAAPLSPLVGLCTLGVFVRTPGVGARAGWITLVGVAFVAAIALVGGEPERSVHVADDGGFLVTSAAADGDTFSREEPLSLHVVAPRRPSIDLTLDLETSTPGNDAPRVLTVEIGSFTFDGQAPRAIIHRRFATPGAARRITLPVEILPAHPVTLRLLEPEGRAKLLGVTTDVPTQKIEVPVLDVKRENDELVFTLEGGVANGVYVAFFSRGKLPRGNPTPPLAGMAWLDPAGTVMAEGVPRQVVLIADEAGRAVTVTPRKSVEAGDWVQAVGEGGFSTAAAVR